MALSKQEIAPGVVAYLDTDRLYADSRVRCVTGKTEFRAGPYLCVHVKGEMSIWLSLTSRRGYRRRRFRLEWRWRIGGSDRWQREDSYIYHAGMPYVGLADAFVEASGVEHSPHLGQRPRLSEEGLLAVEDEMRRAGVASLWKWVREGGTFGLKRPQVQAAAALSPARESSADDASQCV